MESFNYSSSKKMKLNQVIDLRLTNYKAGIIRNGEHPRVLSCDLKVCIETNKYIFRVAKSKAFKMQS